MQKDYTDYLAKRYEAQRRLAGKSSVSNEMMAVADRNDCRELRKIMPCGEGLDALAHRIMQELRDSGCTIRQARRVLEFVHVALEHQPVEYPDMLLVGNRRLGYCANSASSDSEGAELPPEYGCSASMENPL